MDLVDQDDEMARAIALSLQDAQTTLTQGREDEEVAFQEQMRQAIESSKTEVVQQSSTSKVNSFLSERAQLEKERLERQKRSRKAQGLSIGEEERPSDDDDDVQIVEPSAKRQCLSSLSSGMANGRTIADSSSSSQPSKAVPIAGSSRVTTGANGSDALFWEGEFRPTATMGVEPRKDGKPTFRLSTILGKKTDIAFAILSTFALDIAWIYSLFDPSVPVIMVSQPDASGNASMKNVLPNWIKTMPVLKGGFGCMHMKFMLIFYKTGRLRVAISTANLIPFDWRDIENAIWVQDLPPLPKPATFDKTNSESFQYVMKRVLDGIHVKPALATMLRQGHSNLPIKSTEEICTRWDWSKVKVHLVPSISGRHEGWPAVILTGHTRLMKAIRSMGLGTGNGRKEKKLALEYQGSSIGQYNTQWLNEFYYSARGESAQDWLDKPRRHREKLPYPSDLSIIFPSRRTVRGSQHGEPGGGTIFCRRAQWEAKNFPRELFRDSKSKAGNTLMHTKMIIARVSDNVRASASKNADECGSTTEDDSDEIEVVNEPIGWAYLGSHNFTPSAWGTISGSAFNPVLNVRNYELGIVFPLKTRADIDRVACFERPPPRYAADSDGPWIQEESAILQGQGH